MPPGAARRRARLRTHPRPGTALPASIMNANDRKPPRLSLSDALTQVTRFVVSLMPIGVFAITATATGSPVGP